MKVNEKYYDEVFDFAGQWEMPSKCGLKVLKQGNLHTILVTELYQDNPGTSVTYAAGSLIKQICDAKGLSPEKIVYIECNPETGSKLSFYDEEFFKVDFELDNGMPVNLRYSQLNEEQIRSYFDF